MTIEEAKIWAIKKWEYIIDNNGSESGLINKYPELEIFVSECSYCELFYDAGANSCVGCPLVIKGNIKCWQSPHPFENYLNCYSKETAQAVLDLIKNN